MNDKHAYLIIAHNQFPLLGKLLHMLDHPRNDIFLHIDKKAVGCPTQKLYDCVEHSRLFFVDATSVYWGHSSQVDSEMILLKAAVKQGDYAYMHLLSGADLPIQKQSDILAFFDQHPHTQFLQVGNAAIHRQRLSQYHLTMGKKKCPFIKRILANIEEILNNKCHVDRLKKYGDITLVKTANWFSITGDCAKYVVEKARFIKKLTRYTVCADEMFLGTVLYDSPFWKQVYNPQQSWDGHMRLIDRERHVGSSPHTLTMEDKELIDNSPLLFARKFDETVDANITRYVFETYQEDAPRD